MNKRKVISQYKKIITTSILLSMVSVISLSDASAAPRRPRMLNGSKVDLSDTNAAYIENSTGSCSGLLVASNLILTAAHCINESAANFSVVVQGKIYQVSEAYYNGNYAQDVGATLENDQHDTGMLVLSTPVENASPTPIIYNLKYYSGDTGTVAGFGGNEVSDQESQLYETGRVGEVIIRYVESGVLLADKTSKVSVCHGDSGGPLLGTADFDKSIQWVAGTVSAGTNPITDSGVCQKSKEPISIFADLQSASSRNFLSYFPALTYLNGSNVLAYSIDGYLSSLSKSVGKLQITQAKKSVKSFASFVSSLIKTASPNRSALLKKQVAILKKANKSRNTKEIVKLIAQAKVQGKPLKALGVY